jgi:predicted phosphodiesterase
VFINKKEMLTHKIKTFSFQLISDVHLELYNARKVEEFIARKEEDMRDAWRMTLRGECMDEERLNTVISGLLVPSADYLIVAGDLCDFTTFAYMTKQSQMECAACYADVLMQFFAFYRTKFKKIFYVLGNHEFYRTYAGLSATVNFYKARIAQLNAKENEEKVILLEKTHYVLQEGDARLHLLGTTLWSEIDERTSFCMNDYNKIRLNGEKITYNDTLKKFKKNEAWLKDTLASIDESEQVAIITHHLPSYDLIDPLYADSPCNAGFASNLDYMMEKSNVQAWFFGHTHRSATKKIHNCMCYCNPRGYPDHANKNENDQYSPTFKAEIVVSNV